MEINPTDKRILEIFEKIKEEDPNWRENLKNGYYMPKSSGNRDPFLGVMFLLFIIVGFMFGMVKLIELIWK